MDRRVASQKFLSIIALTTSLSLYSLPQDMQLEIGKAQIEAGPQAIDITTSHQAILHWKQFSIGEGERVHFHQPSSSSAVLNRVKGGEASHIFGQLQANGKVYLINPSGIVIGKNGVIKTAGFLASTLDCLDEAFLDGKEILFSGDSQEAIINYGTIEAHGGSVTLMGRMIDNQGSLKASEGKVSLLAGQEILLKPHDTALITIRPESNGMISHEGRIEAMTAELQAEGNAYAYGINLQGSIVALNTVERNGKVYLKADGISLGAVSNIQADEALIETSSRPLYSHGKVDVSSLSIDAFKMLNTGELQGSETVSIKTHGPYIETAAGKIIGGNISIHSDASLYTSGSLIGRIIKIDGHDVVLSSATACGDKITVGETATTVRLMGDTRLNVLEGGEIKIWSEEKTICYGILEAPSGFIEVSSKGEIHCRADLRASSISLDPKNIVIADPPLGVYPQYEFIDPNVLNGFEFGRSTTPLLTGNVVVTKPLDDFEATNAGAVYLYNGLTAALISTLTGSSVGDQVGSEGAVEVGPGNFVVRSTSWNGSRGAATWGSGISGVSGTVSSLNSLVGATVNDKVGIDGITVLASGHYVVVSSEWNNGSVVDAGAVTWGSGTEGVVGAVSAVNSLVGTKVVGLASDRVGSGGVTELTNGNYVVNSPQWNYLSGNDNGAVTWGKGTTGVAGPVSPSNSLVGVGPQDAVGLHGVTALTNGNYVINSPFVTSGSPSLSGAVTWGDGEEGTIGFADATNSLYGTQTADRVGLGGITALTNGNYVVVSTTWVNGATLNAGAVTWGNGEVGTIGSVTTSNSLVGSAASHSLGSGGVIALTNGNYVAFSPAWAINMGAATWGDGSTTGVRLVGTITSSNSLVGVTGGIFPDRVGSGGGVQLTNGNYAVLSPVWSSLKGAVTRGNGAATDPRLVGTITSSNSIIGSVGTDRIGLGGAVPLLDESLSGNYVIISTTWSGNKGAATWQSGTGGPFGTVTSTNSLVGAAASDRVGSGGVLALSNGNYVVLSPLGLSGMGAATWGNGAVGTAGTISSSNSLVGSSGTDAVGSSATAVGSSNYVVLSPAWNGTLGAATWGDGTGGLVGTVSSSNSLVGTQVGDRVGSSGCVTLSNGNYVVSSPEWLDGALNTVGAATWGNGNTGITGSVTPQNSIVGIDANILFSPITDDSVNGSFVCSFPFEMSGIVRVGIYFPSQMTYARAEAQDMTVTPQFLTDTLNTGGSVVLQASNDLTVSNPISATAGSLTFRAGRNTLINADIAMGGGDLTIIANDLLSNGVVDAYRDPGIATLSIANGVTLDAGSGSITLSLLNGAGKTNSSSGDLMIGDNAILQCSGAGSLQLFAQQNNVVLGSNALLQTVDGTLQLTAGVSITSASPVTVQTTGTGQLILVSDNLFPTSPGMGLGNINLPQALLLTGGDKLLIYTSDRSFNTMPSTINGVLFVPGPLFVNSVTEKWGIYYPNSSGIPFTIFYKQPPPDLHALIIAVVEPFRLWTNPWFNDLYFIADPYPPYLTPKELLLRIPSLVAPEK